MFGFSTILDTRRARLRPCCCPLHSTSSSPSPPTALFALWSSCALKGEYRADPAQFWWAELVCPLPSSVDEARSARTIPGSSRNQGLRAPPLPI
ncbi:hypothetical protein LX32DRAFT_138431 [Colletotrichum zoysiae]|uniref:Uncharacterized protein n=1 Tax=Colletotrichum zoysiae TaxID=1216348 RepID=A0AAD9HR14_9PEZI|nr:hypothetical protein LX32DRAFT_138431 [Colletotrichum zoysiae]